MSGIKLENIESSTVDLKDRLYPAQVAAVATQYVEVFGALTHSLQSKSTDLKHLRSSERGTFVINRMLFQSERFAEHRKMLTQKQ